MLDQLGAATVAPWTPQAAIADGVADGGAVERFIARISAGYTAQAVTFSPAEALTVLGRHFAVVREHGGLSQDSIHTIGRFKWHQAFAKLRNVRLLHDIATPPLIAASSGYDNYYHWTAETIGALLIHRLLWPESKTAAVIPAITTAWQRGALELFDLPYELIEVAQTDAAVFDQAVLTNITARDLGIHPHPAIARQFRDRLPLASLPPSAGKLVYVARLDAGDRRHMTNEEELCAVLSRHGFQIIVPGTMTVKAQASAFADAALIVAPHGAALANLLYTGEGQAGPSVIELQQEGYLSGGFAKLSQAKSLDYSVIVNPCIDRTQYHHHTVWKADIDLIEKTVIRKLETMSAKT